MHISNIFTKNLSFRWRSVISGPRQFLGRGIIFSRLQSSAVILESKLGQPGYRKKEWSAIEVQILQSAIDERLEEDLMKRDCGVLRRLAPRQDIFGRQ